MLKEPTILAPADFERPKHDSPLKFRLGSIFHLPIFYESLSKKKEKKLQAYILNHRVHFMGSLFYILMSILKHDLLVFLYETLSR